MKLSQTGFFHFVLLNAIFGFFYINSDTNRAERKKTPLYYTANAAVLALWDQMQRRQRMRERDGVSEGRAIARKWRREREQRWDEWQEEKNRVEEEVEKLTESERISLLSMLLSGEVQYSGKEDLEKFSLAEQSNQNPSVPLTQLKEVSNTLRDLFEQGDVTEFNRLKSQYPDFPFDLRSIKCRGQSLKGIDLRYAILADSDFSGCEIEDALFQNSYLSGARFSSFASHYGETKLSQSEFKGAVFQPRHEIEFIVNELYGKIETPGCEACRIADGSTGCIDRMERVSIDYLMFDEDDFASCDLDKGVTSFEYVDLSNVRDIGLPVMDSWKAEIMAQANTDKIFTFSSEDLPPVHTKQEIMITYDFSKLLQADARDSLTGKKISVLSGDYESYESMEIINTDPNLVIILYDFYTDGFIKTSGDIIFCKSPRFKTTARFKAQNKFSCRTGINARYKKI